MHYNHSICQSLTAGVRTKLDLRSICFAAAAVIHWAVFWCQFDHIMYYHLSWSIV